MYQFTPAMRPTTTLGSILSISVRGSARRSGRGNGRDRRLSSVLLADAVSAPPQFAVALTLRPTAIARSMSPGGASRQIGRINSCAQPEKELRKHRIRSAVSSRADRRLGVDPILLANAEMRPRPNV